MVRRKSRPRNSASVSTNRSKDTEVIIDRRKRKSKVLQEIKYLRTVTKLIIPKKPFSRLVREIVIDIFPRLEINRMQASALEALQEATEMYIVQFFEDAILLAHHAKRITLMRNDMILLRRLRGRDDVINR